MSICVYIIFKKILIFIFLEFLNIKSEKNWLNKSSININYLFYNLFSSFYHCFYNIVKIFAESILKVKINIKVNKMLIDTYIFIWL